MNLSELFGTKKKNINSLFLGSPEAEAEASELARIPLLDVYEDFHGLGSALEAEKFIVIARKGCGKSAFAEFVTLKSKRSATLFAKFVRNSEFALEQLAQQTTSSAQADSVTFFRWLVYVNLLSMIAESEAAKADSRFSHLRIFLEKNSGFVDIREFEIKEVVRKHGFEISTDAFQKYFRAKYGRNLDIKSERAPFYRLLPHLQELVVDLLSGDTLRANENSFFVFFDDLDLGYTPSNPVARTNLMNLVRVCKDINNNVFRKNGLDAKVVVLLRDDVEADVSQNFADSAKIFSSYAIRLSWYQDSYLRHLNEDDLYLKRFINKRIQYAFKNAGFSMSTEDPWNSLVRVPDKSSFKFVVNKTLFRPRDLLLFFMPLENGYFSFPLDYTALKTLAQQYSTQLVKELRNEMLLSFEARAIDSIFAALGKISQRSGCSYDEAARFMKEALPDVDSIELINYLFDRSIIGNKNVDAWFTFKCRQTIGQLDTVRCDPAQQIVVQYGVLDYLEHRGFR